MIKMIASDLDGTLLQNGAQSLEPPVFELIRCLREKGILFVAASGRQYPNMRRMFSKVWKDILFVCESGALVMSHDQPIFTSPMPRALGDAIISDILAHEGCEVLLSGADTSYFTGRCREYADFITYTMKNTVTVVDDLFSVDRDILKISAFVHNGRAAQLVPYFTKRWGNRVSVALSGAEWIDFTTASKGTAIRVIQERFGFAREEMMAFGDNFNDREMLEVVGHPYVMENAAPDVRALCPNHCRRVEDVLQLFSRPHSRPF